MHRQRTSRFENDPVLSHQGRPEGQVYRTRVGEAIRSGKESVQGVVSEYPMSTLLGSFALGAAVGVTLGLVLAESFEPPRWYERVPDSLGRTWIETLLQVLPESVRNKVR